MGRAHRSVGALDCSGGVVPYPRFVVTADAHRRGHRARRTRRGPRKIDMRAPTRAYFRDLNTLVNALFKDINKELTSKLPKWVAEEERQEKQDAKSDDSLTADAVDDEIGLAVRLLKQKYSSRSAIFTFKSAADKAAKRTEKVNGLQTKSQLKSLGIDVFREAPQLNRLLSRFTRRNTALITSMPQQSIDNVAQIIERGFASGLRAEEMAKQITSIAPTKAGATSSELRKAKNRAQLIARDQTLSMSGELSRERQTANGIDKFVWQTVGDARVRDLHDDRDGDTFTWEDGASGGDKYPGVGVNCRCFAEPVL